MLYQPLSLPLPLPLRPCPCPPPPPSFSLSLITYLHLFFPPSLNRCLFIIPNCIYGNTKSSVSIVSEITDHHHGWNLLFLTALLF
ncbi:hypothetical protein HanIR_Chr04g0169961 [Helianthus annuus]|nr:hypothetical protein HanIR_Chr04g0169961 [Helianthus annuus]